MRILAGVLSLGRLLVGVALINRPRLMEGAWIGRQGRLPGAQVLARGVGARDTALGLGGLQAVVRDDGSAPAWMSAAAMCDAVDFGASWAAGRGIPRAGRNGVLVIAGAAAALSALAAFGTRGSRHAEPLGASGGEDVTEAGAVASEPVRVA